MKNPNKKSLHLVKIGGNVVDHPEALDLFLKDFHKLFGHKILVHGGGKMASRFSERLGIEPQMHNGRRITDRATLEVVTMVYAGWINKNLVAALQGFGTNAIGLTGADAGIIRANKRPPQPIDFGFVGDVEKVDAAQLATMLDSGMVPVLSPITHDGHGQLLNTNADTIAAETAMALSQHFDVSLTFCFEKKGVLSDPSDDGSVVSRLTAGVYEELLDTGIITAGMMPKLENCYRALTAGVRQVYITHASHLPNGDLAVFEGTEVCL